MNSPNENSNSQSSQERLLLYILSAIQFTIVLDFLIIMPMGPQYMRIWSISPAEFSIIVSSYAVSAGMAGLLGGLYVDRFDRKSALLFVYAGFIVGTFMCALAYSYQSLILARIVAGAFGGIVSSLILSIVGDVIPNERRGRAMGIVMSAFSLASVCGVPIGLVVASQLSWQAPFHMLAALSLTVCIVAAAALPMMKNHLNHVSQHNCVRVLLNILARSEHQIAFTFMGFLTLTGFLIFPHISNYLVSNVGFTERQLPLVYIFGGAFTIVSMNLIGRWSDRAGKHRVFTAVSIVALFPVLILTNLPQVPISVALVVTTLFMMSMSGRSVPAMALMTGSIEARYRGGFMSVNSSIQQFASGFGSYLSGRLLGLTAEGRITHFYVVGIVSLACALICIYLSKHLKLTASR